MTQPWWFDDEDDYEPLVVPAEPSPITFPTTPLAVKVEVAVGADVTALPATWGWADATGRIYTRDPVTIVRGRADQASVADTSTCALTANNRDGRWSTRNPNGAWYGQLRKGTPIRVFAEGYPRYSGFLSALPPRWDISGEDRYAPLAAKGLFYRLGLGAAPLRSALRRTLAAGTPDVYVPLEDGASATAAAVVAGLSPVLAGPAGIRPAGLAGPVGAASLTDFDIGVGRITVPASVADTGFWSISFIASGTMAASPNPTMCNVEIDTTGGTQATYKIAIYAGWSGGAFTSTIGVDLLSPAMTTFTNAPTANVFDSDTHEVQVRFTQNGANIDCELFWDGTSVDTASAAGTLGTPIAIRAPISATGSLDAITVDNTGAAMAFGHLSLHTDAAVGQFYTAMNGYDGEAAHTRFLRLCAEENIPATAQVAEDRSVLMGPQPVEAVLPLLRECEAADQAFMYEGVEFDLIFQGHTARENLVPALALDYTNPAHGIVPPLEATDDDQDARNDVEVKRDGGSSTRLTEEDPLVELSIPNIGRRSESVTYKIANDGQTRDLAGWRLHLGTFPGYRYPTLSLNLAAAPGLIPAFATAGLGFLTTTANPPDDIGPDEIALIGEGYTETLGIYDWDVAANCSLNGPWHVIRTAETTGDSDDFLGYLIPDTCVTCEALDTTTTEFLFMSEPRFSTDSDDWTPAAALRIGGEEIALSAVASAARDAFGRDETDTWGVTTTGQTWVTNQTAADWDVTTTPFGHGTLGITTLEGDYLAIFDVGYADVDLVATFRLDALPASGGYRFGLSARSTLATTGSGASFYHGEAQINSAGQITLRLRKRVQGTQSNIASRVLGTLVAGAAYRLRFAVIGTTLAIKIWTGDASATNEPEWWYLTATDATINGVTLGGTYAGVFARDDTASATHVLSVDDYEVLRPQLATVARSANTVSKAHLAGSTLEFAHPGVLGL